MTNGSDCAFPNIRPNGEPQSGLTIREYFAGLAMQGCCADPNMTDATAVAEAAVRFADALIAELNKGEKQ